MILFLAIWVGVWWYLVVDLFCIPLVTDKVFTYLQAIRRISFVNGLFTVSCPFSTGCVFFLLTRRSSLYVQDA